MDPVFCNAARASGDIHPAGAVDPDFLAALVARFCAADAFLGGQLSLPCRGNKIRIDAISFLAQCVAVEVMEPRSAWQRRHATQRSRKTGIE